MDIIYGVNLIRWILIFSVFCMRSIAGKYFEYDHCVFEKYDGRCLAVSNCTSLPDRLSLLGLNATDLETCGFTVNEEIICCPRFARTRLESTEIVNIFGYDATLNGKENNHELQYDIRKEYMVPISMAKEETYLEIENSTRVDIWETSTMKQEENINKSDESDELDESDESVEPDGLDQSKIQNIISVQQNSFFGKVNLTAPKNKKIETTFSEIRDHKNERNMRDINFIFNINPTLNSNSNQNGGILQINAFFNQNNLSASKALTLMAQNIPVKKDLSFEDNNQGNINIHNGNRRPGPDIYGNPYSARPIPINNTPKENDPCETENYKGRCAVAFDCPKLRSDMENLDLGRKSVGRCGFNGIEELICCPQLDRTIEPSPIRPIEISSQGIPETKTNEIEQNTEDLPVGKNQNLPKRQGVSIPVRPAERACTEIEKKLMPDSPANGGLVLSPTEYPHMAGIVYDNGELKCGGTLIEKHFVLTAAHCLKDMGAKAVKVRLGVTDFNDTTQMQDLVEIDIKDIYVHESYSTFSHYFDIGLIELAKDVEYAPNVYPTCLQTNKTDLPAYTKLVATGWGGTVNDDNTGRLLNIYVNYMPVAGCRDFSFGDSRLNHGIDETQLCAFVPVKDACLDGSGGPIHLVKDKSMNNYRVVGVASFTKHCDSVPVYTRVTAFLDFIESIVWPEI